jgi:pinin/SDK/memA/ protein conserved region
VIIFRQIQPPSKEQVLDTDATMQDAPQATTPGAVAPKKRPRLDLTIEPRERKRGKSMFGLLVGTLNKAKTEDEARNASEAVQTHTSSIHNYACPDLMLQAKKRQLIDKRLQDRLRKETDSVRRAEEAKKDKHTANRKEEEIQLKNSIVSHLRADLDIGKAKTPCDLHQHRLRRTRLPILANFLLTSDLIPSEDSSPSLSHRWVLEPSRSHPPPLYYLPVVLTPSQDAFIAKRKAEVICLTALLLQY